jgi:hypothetical protein
MKTWIHPLETKSLIDTTPAIEKIDTTPAIKLQEYMNFITMHGILLFALFMGNAQMNALEDAYNTLVTI